MTDEMRQSSEFEAEATRGRTGLVREFWDFLKNNKKWWLLPIIVVMALVGVLAILVNSPAAPFIYSMF